MKYERFTWKTEKLQHSDDEVIMVVDNANKDWKGHILNVVDLLNNLTEENEQLRHEIEIEKKWQLEKDKYYAKIKEENEKLKKVIDLMEYQMKVQDRIIKEYEDGESNEL